MPKDDVDLNKLSYAYFEKNKFYNRQKQTHYIDGLFSAFVKKGDAIKLDDKVMNS